MMKDALEFLNTELNAAVGEPSVYSRGEISSDCVAVRASCSADQFGEDDGVTIQTRLADILITVNDFDQDKFGKPKKGDIITIDGDKFAVVNRKPGGAWTWSDSHKTKYRIHVKDVNDG